MSEALLYNNSSLTISSTVAGARRSSVVVRPLLCDGSSGRYHLVILVMSRSSQSFTVGIKKGRGMYYHICGLGVFFFCLFVSWVLCVCVCGFVLFCFVCFFVLYSYYSNSASKVVKILIYTHTHTYKITYTYMC